MPNRHKPADFHYYFAVDLGDYKRFGKYLQDANVLASYVHLDGAGRNPEKEHAFLNALKAHPGRVMIDSGGFTNFTTPGTVKFEDWLEFTKANHKWVDEYVQFDDLRSRPETLKLYKAARDAGLDPLFVDHLWFDDEPEVEKVWKERDKLAISGFAITLPGQEKFPGAGKDRLDKAIARGREVDTYVHMLAVGSLRKYLHHFDRINSVDSAAFDKETAYGKTLVYERGKIKDFDVPLIKIYSYPEGHRQHQPMPDDVKKAWVARTKAHKLDKLSPSDRATTMSIIEIKRYVQAIKAMDHNAFRKHLDAVDKAVQKSVLEGDEFDSFYFPPVDELDRCADDAGWTVTSAAISKSVALLKAAGEELSPAEARKLLVALGPPNEWSGGIADSLGPERRKALRTAWDAMDKAEQRKVFDEWEASMDGEAKKYAADVPFARAISKAEQPEGSYVLGIVLEPTDHAAGLKPDAQNDIYSEDDCRSAFEWFCTKGRQIKLMHKGRPLVDGRDYVILDNYTTPVAFTLGNEQVRKGSWLMGLSVLDAELRKDIRSGEFQGYSIGGSGRRRQVQ